MLTSDEFSFKGKVVFFTIMHVKKNYAKIFKFIFSTSSARSFGRVLQGQQQILSTKEKNEGSYRQHLPPENIKRSTIHIFLSMNL